MKILGNFILLPLRLSYSFIKKNIKAILFVLIGSIFIFLGIIGSILPIIPGIPFIALGVALYARAFSKLTGIIMKTPAARFVHREIPTKIKVMVVLSLWLSIFIPTIISIKNYWAWAVSGIICASLTIYVMRIKNLAEFISGRKDDKEEKSR
jgi:uncharacterized membrane protein YbaN (DUF454 family)